LEAGDFLSQERKREDHGYAKSPGKYVPSGKGRQQSNGTQKESERESPMGKTRVSMLEDKPIPRSKGGVKRIPV